MFYIYKGYFILYVYYITCQEILFFFTQIKHQHRIGKNMQTVHYIQHHVTKAQVKQCFQGPKPVRGYSLAETKYLRY